MTLVPDRFIVQAIVRDIDAEGAVTREIVGDQIVLYGVAQLKKWAADFTENLAAEEAATRG